MRRKRVVVWDLPTRLYHWLLTFAFLAAFAIPFLVGETSTIYIWHMFLGAVVGFVALLRVIWGFIGTRWARFDAFRLRPSALFTYLRDLVTGESRRYVGHNPASSVIDFLVIGLALAMPLTGIWMVSGGEVIRELHASLSRMFAGAMVMQFGGIVLYTIQHADATPMSLVDGRKRVSPTDGIRSSRPIAGAIFALLVLLWSAGLIANYDPATRKLRVPVVEKSIAVGPPPVDREPQRRRFGASTFRATP